MRNWCVGAGLVVGFALAAWHAQAGGSFDKLSDADRQAFGQRFATEVWPLLKRGGKDGCVGCHRAGSVTALHFTDDPAKDFRMLLKEGFLLSDDAGSLHARITDKDAKRRMPPGKRPSWSAKEAESLRTFILDLEKKQQK